MWLSDTQKVGDEFLIFSAWKTYAELITFPGKNDMTVPVYEHSYQWHESDLLICLDKLPEHYIQQNLRRKMTSSKSLYRIAFRLSLFRFSLHLSQMSIIFTPLQTSPLSSSSPDLLICKMVKYYISSYIFIDFN